MIRKSAFPSTTQGERARRSVLLGLVGEGLGEHFAELRVEDDDERGDPLVGGEFVAEGDDGEAHRDELAQRRGGRDLRSNPRWGSYRDGGTRRDGGFMNRPAACASRRGSKRKRMCVFSSLHSGWA